MPKAETKRGNKILTLMVAHEKTIFQLVFKFITDAYKQFKSVLQTYKKASHFKIITSQIFLLGRKIC